MRLFAAACSLVLLFTACAPRPSAVLGQTAAGCTDALRERAAALGAIDSAEKQALQRNAARAAELQAAASGGKGAVVAAADLGPCDKPEPASGGVVVDVADLRQRYRVVVDQATARLGDIASRPAPPQRGKEKKGSVSGD